MPDIESIDLRQLTPGRRTKILRLVAGLSADQLAATWGKSRDYVYRIERDEGGRKPTPPEWETLERVVVSALGGRVKDAVLAAGAEAAASRPLRGSTGDAPGAEAQAEVQALLERRLAEVESENAEMRRQLAELGEDAPAPPSPRQAEG